MSEKLKTPKKGAAQKIKGSMDKLVYQPVSKRVGDLLVESGRLERETKKNKKIASEKRTPDFEAVS